MTTIITVLAVLIATTAVIVLKREEPKTPMSFYESMKLVNLPVVTFKIGAEDINLMLDSGGMKNFIDSRVVELLKLPHEKLKENNKISVYGITGNIMENEVIHMHVQYKGMDFEDDFIAQDLSGSMDTLKQEFGVRIHGMLGASFFEKYRYILDFKNLIAYTKK
jgi:hypothetical protein